MKSIGSTARRWCLKALPLLALVGLALALCVYAPPAAAQYSDNDIMNDWIAERMAAGGSGGSGGSGWDPTKTCSAQTTTFILCEKCCDKTHPPGMEHEACIALCIEDKN